MITIENKLTDRDIQEMDTIYFDIKATDNSLIVASNFHMNRMARLLKKETLWWNDKRDRFNLNPKKTYVMDSTGPNVILKEKKEEEVDLK